MADRWRDRAGAVDVLDMSDTTDVTIVEALAREPALLERTLAPIEPP